MDTRNLTTLAGSPADIDRVLEAFLARKLDEAAHMSPYYQQLWDEIARMFHSGGKRLRSRTVLLAYSMYGGENIATIVPAAAAQELIHLGMLIHDDIIDRDVVRYGVDNIAGSYRTLYAPLVADESDRLHYSNSAALLAGDLMLSEAYLLMGESRVPAEKILEVQRLLGQGVFEVIGGELLDTESAFRSADAISPETIALHKTASYSFMMPLLVGAVLASASYEDQLKLRVFGRHLGIAFQLRDDIIGVFGDEKQTGKTVTGDIREGKRTYMVEQFFTRATETQLETFNQYFGNPTVTDEEADVVRDLLRTSGALQATEDEIERYELQAREILPKLAIKSEYHEQVSDYISAVTKRVK